MAQSHRVLSGVIRGAYSLNRVTFTHSSSSSMRKKQTPYPAKRRRRWPLYEWFIPHLDYPYFSHSEFRDVIVNDMGLAPLLEHGTREQWARARAAMCNALPVGFATPRRLSHAFLAAEREELAQYRDDARRVLRRESLLPGTDVATGMPLPSHWWMRRRCPPPRVLEEGEKVLVRRGYEVCEGVFVKLVGKDEIKIGMEGETVIVSDLNIMGAAEGMEHAEMPQVHVMQSPRGAISVSPQKSKGEVECEVDVAQLANSIRLLDRKKELLIELKALNNSADMGIDDNMRERYRAILYELDAVGRELDITFVSQHPKNNAMIVSPGIITQSPKRQKTLPELQLRPEHMAKNVDFRSAAGTALLAKVLTREALSKMGPMCRLKELPAGMRADIIECVSACVAVLTRARSTRDYRCIEEVVEGIRVHFAGNAEALEAIQEAARTFETASSESL